MWIGVALVIALFLGSAVLGALDDSYQQELTPAANAINDQAMADLIALIESGALYGATETSKQNGAAGNWQEAFGVVATQGDIDYVKQIALLFQSDMEAGRDCDYFDRVVDQLAIEVGTDRGRAEYVFIGPALVWMEPRYAVRLFQCF